jgi:hypothetical protein
MDNYIKDHLDIFGYFKHIDILEKMRSIIFNRQQNATFEFLRIPNLSNKEEYNSYIKTADGLKIILELLQYYSSRLSRTQ